MTKRSRDLRKRGTGAVTAGGGQATSSAGQVAAARRGTVVHRVVPAHLACRVGARARAGEGDAWPAVISIAMGTFALVFSELIPQSGPPFDAGVIAETARIHERAGFDRVLIGYFSDAPDGFLVGAHAASVTERLGFLLAHRPGFVAPPLAAPGRRGRGPPDVLTPGRPGPQPRPRRPRWRVPCGSPPGMSTR